jgi:acyl phosphate:glycerol-3-phosphate acyltransferase
LAAGLPGSNWPAGTKLYLALAGFFAVAGHMFPLWLKFRGGKGVATGLGAFFVLAPRAILLAVVVFIIMVAIFRYVSLGSIAAAASFPLFMAKGAIHNSDVLAFMFVVSTSLLIIIRHHENIRRLLSGTESRIGARRS